jgi:hypothetical protein
MAVSLAAIIFAAGALASFSASAACASPKHHPT